MKILLLGKNGQVGWELQRSLQPLGELVALDRNSSPLCGDLLQPVALAEAVRAIKPDVIVNAAAYTAVDKAESDADAARTINAEAVGVLAREAKALEAWLVHYSTDYVFDGSGSRTWQESDATGPLSVYGQTKLEGEQAIAKSGARHLVFRTSWVYAARGGNFAKTMLRLAQERDKLAVIDDQWGAPTGAELIADVTAHALRAAMAGEQDLSGIYHLVAGGETTWNRYAQFVLAQARQINPALGITAREVQAVATSAFPTPAKRPNNSRLNTQKLQQSFGLALPDWQVGVQRMLREIL
ncbi:dTDP-4-dehydrorhamnose reductase [Comamonas odontotermitis]|uniref:dTDP-4-dehydrorhamnose reductase n=1 Tax=Comamonas odontotermitis TaxID=379895 RepID=A0ABR6RCM5_9BURK|nr:dTDP-4-dehydrorhamnose reductase [Comamonas odontotermitis]